MNRFMLTVSVLATSIAVVPAHAGFKAAKWGMTPEQVAAAMAGEAPQDSGSSGKKLQGKTIGNVGSHELNGRRFHSTYYYDDRGLAMVALDGPPKQCVDIYKEMVAERGRPYRTSDQVLFTLFIWHDASDNNRLRLMASPRAGVCTLYYERLDDYKAVDDAQAAQGR